MKSQMSVVSTLADGFLGVWSHPFQWKILVTSTPNGVHTIDSDGNVKGIPWPPRLGLPEEEEEKKGPKFLIPSSHERCNFSESMKQS